MIVATTIVLAARQRPAQLSQFVFWLPFTGVIIVSVYIVWFYATWARHDADTRP